MEYPIGDLTGVSDLPYCRSSRADTFGDTVAPAPAIKRLTMVEVDMTAVVELRAYYPFKRKSVG
jgi:hypothetical protein